MPSGLSTERLRFVRATTPRPEMLRPLDVTAALEVRSGGSTIRINGDGDKLTADAANLRSAVAAYRTLRSSLAVSLQGQSRHAGQRRQPLWVHSAVFRAGIHLREVQRPGIRDHWCSRQQLWRPGTRYQPGNQDVLHTQVRRQVPDDGKAVREGC